MHSPTATKAVGPMLCSAVGLPYVVSSLRLRDGHTYCQRPAVCPLFASSSWCQNTAMHPVKQLGYTLFAPSGTKIWLFAALAATECAVLAGCSLAPEVTAGTLKVGTSCRSAL